MSCKKCNSIKTVTLRKKDFYCDQCFMVNTNHKFRACIGKSKVLSPNENVLICLSGGMGSTVLMDLISYSLSLDNNKKLRINPYFLHIHDNDNKDVAESVLQKCQKYNFNIYMVHISDYMISNNQLPIVNNINNVEQNILEMYNVMMSSLPPTARNDFILKVRKSLYKKYARHLECKTIFTAETANTLAKHILCNLAAGRGEQIQNDTGFMDSSDENVKIIRPMKDISLEELEYYVKIKQLDSMPLNNIQNNSLQSVISCFVNDLQENFQATISTVCKTADKIGNQDEVTADEHCIICECPLNFKKLQLSALEATNISSAISYNKVLDDQGVHMNTPKYLENLKNDLHLMFPLSHNLCYGCSRNYSEMKEPSLPPHIMNRYRSCYQCEARANSYIKINNRHTSTGRTTGHRFTSH